MDDIILERLALLAIIFGLLLVLFLMPKYDFVDAHFLFEDDNKAFLEGEILRLSYSESNGWSFVEIKSCRTFDAFFEGEVNKSLEDTIFIKGSYYDDAFSIKEYK
ncbi:MAG: hypothetical protein ACLFN8_02440 [Candidatus Woesearchaeota archaeon]